MPLRTLSWRRAPWYQNPSVRYAPPLLIGWLGIVIPAFFTDPLGFIMVAGVLVLNVSIFLVMTFMGWRLAVRILRPSPAMDVHSFTLRGAPIRLGAPKVGLLLLVSSGLALVAGGWLAPVVLEDVSGSRVVESVSLAAFLVGFAGLVVPTLAVFNAEHIHNYERRTGVARPIRPPFFVAILTASLFLGTLGDLIGADQRANPEEPLEAAFATVAIVVPTVVAPAAIALYLYLVLRFEKDVATTAARLGAVEVDHASEAIAGLSPQPEASSRGTASP